MCMCLILSLRTPDMAHSLVTVLSRDMAISPDMAHSLVTVLSRDMAPSLGTVPNQDITNLLLWKCRTQKASS